MCKCRKNKYPQQNRCCCGYNKYNCGLDSCCDIDILTFLLLRQLIRNVNHRCCIVSPYA